jgi:hypothetical protein
MHINEYHIYEFLMDEVLRDWKKNPGIRVPRVKRICGQLEPHLGSGCGTSQGEVNMAIAHFGLCELAKWTDRALRTLRFGKVGLGTPWKSKRLDGIP